MLSNSTLRPLFSVVSTAQLSDRDLTGIANGTIAAVRVPHMLTPEVCAATVARLDAAPLDSYDPQRVDPPVARFGVAINEYRREGKLSNDYWPHADAAYSDWLSAQFQPDPQTLILESFAQAWGAQVKRATVQQHRLYGGLIREINQGTRIHYDDVSREFPHGIFDQQVVAQLAFNVYLSIPESGGETTVWQRRWTPSDEIYASGYGYTDEVVGDAPSVVIQPELGEGLIFDPRHYHTVNAATGGRRVALAFCMALTGRGELIVWS